MKDIQSGEAGATGTTLQADGARSIPNLGTTRKKANVNKLWIALVVFMALVIATGGVALSVKRWADLHEQHRQEARNAPKDSGSGETGHDFGVDKDRVAREKAEATRQADLASAASRPPVPAGAQPLPLISGTPGAAVQPIDVVPVNGMGSRSSAGAGVGVSRVSSGNATDMRLQGNVLVNPSEDRQAESDAPKSASSVLGAIIGSTNNTSAAAAVQGGLDSRLTPSTLTSVRAGRLPDLDYLLKRGTTIRCGQKTKIVTTYPGMISCIVTKDVYSANGKTLLIERGSEATGEQRTALMQGQARIFTLWSRIDMPNGIKIDLDSPGTDALGASGLDAYVDTHFWQRFGGALMLSLVGDIGQGLSNRTVGGGSNQITLSSTSSSTQSLADETLKNTIDIPPTAYSNQGSEINIYVARDADFRSVYDLANR